METLAAIFGITTMTLLIFGFGLLLLGQAVGTSSSLWDSKKAWRRKLASIGFNYVMPAGIMITIVLVPLILLLGVVTFGAMLFLL